jgi:hypothetical protein
MDLEKLNQETKRLEDEVSFFQTRLRKLPQQILLELSIVLLLILAVMFLSSVSNTVIIGFILVIIGWQITRGIIIFFQLKNAKANLLRWQDTVNLAKESVK